MSRRALPYRIPSESVIQVGLWYLVVDDDAVPMPEALPDWDYHMDLLLRRTVLIDQDEARAQAGLPPETVLMLAVVWTATGSNLNGPARRIRLAGSGPATISLDIDLRGSDLGGVLRIDTALLLAERRSGGWLSSPRRAGSVLWSDRSVLMLQGDAPQFPMAVIDFANTSFPNGAAWHLQISGNLDSATMGSLLLLVNERNSVVTTAFQNAGRPREVDRVVLSAVYADTARAMIEHALALEEFADDADFSSGSLGETLTALFDKLFPGRSVSDMKLRQRQSPSFFASEMQEAVRIFEVPR